MRRYHPLAPLAETRQPTRLTPSYPTTAIDKTPAAGSAHGDLGGLLIQLQRTHGNQFVQRLIQPQSGRKTPGPQPSGRRPPGPVPVLSAPRGTIQAFWVKRLVKRKNVRKERYFWRTANDRDRFFRLNETHSTRKHPLPSAVFVERWKMPGSKLEIRPESFHKWRRKKLKAKTVAALMQIRRTDIGARLLRYLTAKSPRRTVMKPTWVSPPPQTVHHVDGHSDIQFKPEKIFDALDWYPNDNQDRKEVDWRMMPLDVVLFHELVHAYHNARGTTATGIIRAEATDRVDSGVAKSEYQAVGLPPYPSKGFTENHYRAATGRTQRTTYRVPFKPGVQRPRDSWEETDEGASSEGPLQGPTVAREEPTVAPEEED